MTDETVRFLHDLKLPGMAACWASLEETHQLDKVSLRDGMQLMLQHERDTRQANRKATIEELEMDTTRGLSTADVTEQATGGYIRDARFTIVIGPTGTGKTFFINALGERACRQGYKTLYFTMNTLIDQLRLVHLEGRETNFFRKLSAHDLLIIDKALILASQLPVADWYNVFQSELIAEACLDRLVHKSKRFELKGESLRKKY